jgi:hypothetical protein
VPFWSAAPVFDLRLNTLKFKVYNRTGGINAKVIYMPIEHPSHQLRKGFLRHVAPHRHSILLASIVFAFAVRPLIGDTGTSFAMFGMAEVGLLLVALYNISVDEMVGERDRLLMQTRRWRYIGWVLATATGLGRVCAMLFPHRGFLALTASIFLLVFLLFVTLNELRSILKQREVTGETICMAISAYLLLGFTWALLYGIILSSIRNRLQAWQPQDPVFPSTFGTFSRILAISA